MSTSANFLAIGEETTYGTAVAYDRSMPAKADSFVSEPEEIKSGDEIRYNQQVISDNSLLYTPNGGTGTVETMFRTSGMGLFLKAAAGSSAIVTNTQTHSSAPDDSGVSLTIGLGRSRADSTDPSVFEHVGCMVTGFELSHSAKEALMCSFDFNFQDVTKTTGATVPPGVTTGNFLTWRQAAITLDSSPVLAREFKFGVDNKLDVERDYLRTGLRGKPCRVEDQEATVSFEFDYDPNADAIYDQWLANAAVPLQVVWTNGADSLTLDIPSLRISTSKPEASPTEISKSPVEAMVVEPGSGDAWTLTYVSSTDTAF